MLTTQPLANVARIRAMERREIDSQGGDAFALMQRAGLVAWRHASHRFPNVRSLLVCCGSGNNGGDGYLLALHAARAGLGVTVFRCGTPRGELAQRAAAACTDAALEVHEFEGGSLPACDLIVDALIGIGLVDAPRALQASLIDAINAHETPVFSLDVPSGLDSDRGFAPGACVRASHTLTFIARKPGLHTGAGIAHAGVVVLADLGCKADDEQASCQLLEPRASGALPRQCPGDHKGRRGRALIIGGDHGFGGAIVLAAEACARAGAGATTVATRREHVHALLLRRPEIMSIGIDDTPQDTALAGQFDVIGIGPGLGRGEWSQRLLGAVLARAEARVFDADALNLLVDSHMRLREGDVITPHPGEAARLLGSSVVEIEGDRYAAASALARTFGAVVVLKGAGTLVAHPRGCVHVSPHAVAALATAGSGDVLTGIVASMLAQGLDAWDAARVAVLVHAGCGLAVGRARGTRGVLAGDLIDALGGVLNH